MAEYDIKLLLAEDRWHQFRAAQSTAITVDNEFTRYIEGIPIKHVEALVGEVRARRKETNPKCDQKTWGGTWRIAGVTHGVASDKQTAIVYETLRYGFLTTLNQTEARAVSSQGDPGKPGFTVRQAFVYVDPQKLNTLLPALCDAAADLSVTDPQCDGTTYSGKFAVGKFGHTRNDDQSVTLWRDLTQMSTASTKTAIEALTPLKEFKYAQVRMFSTDGTQYHTTNISEKSRQWIYSYRFLDPANRATIGAITNWTVPVDFFFMAQRIIDDADTNTITLEITFADDEVTKYQQELEYGSGYGNVYTKEVHNALPADIVPATGDPDIPAKDSSPGQSVNVTYNIDKRGLLSYSVIKRPASSGEIKQWASLVSYYRTIFDNRLYYVTDTRSYTTTPDVAGDSTFNAVNLPGTGISHVAGDIYEVRTVVGTTTKPE